MRLIPVDRRSAKRPRARCAFEGCESWAKGHGGVNVHCAGHYEQKRQRQELRPLYSGGRSNVGHVNHQGYRLISVVGVAVLQHRAVMEQMIGRPLRSYENVHHMNGEKLDNRPENLELWVNKQPRGQRVSDLIEFVVSHYRPELMRRLEREPGP